MTGEPMLTRADLFRKLPVLFFKSINAWKESTDVGEEKIKLRGIPRLDITRCLAWTGLLCQLCYVACPLRDRVLEMIDGKPLIHESKCDGCGQCLEACLTVNHTPALQTAGREGR